MPYLWIRDQDQIWSALPLSDHPYELGGSFPNERSMDHSVNTQTDDVLLCPVGDDRPARSWVLLWGCGRDVRINGLREFPAGLRLIVDHDEIRVGSNPVVYFTTETLPVVETFEGNDHEMFCPRCKKQIEPGASIVRCVECGLMYHYNTDRKLNCFEYSESCLCGHATRLDAGFRWVPDDNCG